LSAHRRVLALLLAPAENLRLQLSRALVVSILAMIVDVALLSLLVEVAGLPAVSASVIGYLTGGVVQYALCSAWVFPNAPRNVAVGFVAFTILSLGGLGITVATMHVFHRLWGAWWLLAKGVALGLAFNWNFFSRKYFLFQPEETSIPATR
jgi:putative flippase GtrA